MKCTSNRMCSVSMDGTLLYWRIERNMAHSWSLGETYVRTYTAVEKWSWLQWSYVRKTSKMHTSINNLMFIGPCIIAIVDEWKTNLMSLAILFHLCAQQVSDINISIFRSLRLCWWITTSVVLFSVRCVLELLLRLVFGGVRFAGWFFITKFICPLKHFIWN